MQFKSGDYVVWKWAGSIAHGQVIDVVPERVELVSKGKRIVRNGSESNPAVRIRHQNGVEVLKLANELLTTKNLSEDIDRFGGNKRECQQ